MAVTKSKRDVSHALGVEPHELFGTVIDKEIGKPEDRFPVPQELSDKEIGTPEWWYEVRRQKRAIRRYIRDLKKMHKGDKAYSETIRKWTELELRLVKMIGDATGVFGEKTSKSLGTGNTFVVVFPDGHSEQKEITQDDDDDTEEAEYESLDVTDADEDDGDDDE